MAEASTVSDLHKAQVVQYLAFSVLARTIASDGGEAVAHLWGRGRDGSPDPSRTLRNVAEVMWRLEDPDASISDLRREARSVFDAFTATSSHADVRAAVGVVEEVEAFLGGEGLGLNVDGVVGTLHTRSVGISDGLRTSLNLAEPAEWQPKVACARFASAVAPLARSTPTEARALAAIHEAAAQSVQQSEPALTGALVLAGDSAMTGPLA